MASNKVTSWPRRRRIAGASRRWTCAAVLAALLLATGIPVQLSVWNDLPVWYNLAFLILLVPETVFGASLLNWKDAEVDSIDSNALNDDYVTVTPIQSDQTDYAFLKKLKELKIN